MQTRQDDHDLSIRVPGRIAKTRRLIEATRAALAQAQRNNARTIESLNDYEREARDLAKRRPPLNSPGPWVRTPDQTDPLPIVPRGADRALLGGISRSQRVVRNASGRISGAN
jgi:hypothetical protein